MSDTNALIEQLAASLGISRETIRKWRQRGVPYYRREEIREAAEAQRLIIRKDDFDNFATDKAA